MKISLAHNKPLYNVTPRSQRMPIAILYICQLPFCATSSVWTSQLDNAAWLNGYNTTEVKSLIKIVFYVSGFKYNNSS